MKAIFLDIDGVLNCYNSKSYCGIYTGIDSDKIKRLARIVEKTGAKIILSSDWRYDWEKYHKGLVKKQCGKYLDNKLWKKGKLRIYDKTPSIRLEWRGHEIAQYLIDHPEITEWVIFDDNLFDDFYDNKYIEGHFIGTDDEFGLTDKNVEEAIEILRSK